ncbi:MAG: HU family DNA-binding protein [Bacteroidia bacterium]|nr:HU family DNA-binding protein [Bacteroidia bacterium]MDW8088796.1 HU family DNA-binding protein [Bacteroidia bacterium]
MTRKDLIRYASEKTGLSRGDVAAVLKAILEGMEDELMRGGEVALRGFGMFRLKYQRPRKGRLIRTGQTITIPARLKLAFEPSEKLQARLQADQGLLKRFEAKRRA